MADELNIPTHRWYQPRNNIALAPNDVSKQWIYDSGIQKIDAWINSQPWGIPTVYLNFIPSGSDGLITADSLVFKSRLEVTAEGWGIAGPEILLAPSVATPSVPTLTGTILTGPQGTYRIHNVTTDTSTEVEITDETASHDLALYGASTEVVRAYPVGLSGVSPTIDVPAGPSNEISFVGSQVSSRIGRTTDWPDLTFSLSGGSDSTPQAGDLVLVRYAIGSQSGRNPTPSVITSGYTTSTVLRAAGSTAIDQAVYAYKFMGGAPDTSIIFSQTGNVDDASTAMVFVFRGVDPATPLDVTPTTFAVGGSTAGANKPNPAAITPVTAGAWIVALGSQAGSSLAVFTAPTSGLDAGSFRSTAIADIVDSASGGGFYSGWTSGAHDVEIFNGGVSNPNHGQTCHTIALKPA